jgi:hypothetical protein
VAKDILQEQKSNPLIPRHTLQDEELVVLLKALDYYAKIPMDLGDGSEVIALKMAKELRSKAGWEMYSKSQKEIKKIPSHLQQACEVCDD